MDLKMMKRKKNKLESIIYGYAGNSGEGFRINYK